MVDGFGAGKGDKPRNVEKAEYDKNFERIFGTYVPPRIKRLNELEKDLSDCKEALKTMTDKDPDFKKITRLVKIIETEIENL